MIVQQTIKPTSYVNTYFIVHQHHISIHILLFNHIHQADGQFQNATCNHHIDFPVHIP